MVESLLIIVDFIEYLCTFPISYYLGRVNLNKSWEKYHNFQSFFLDNLPKDMRAKKTIHKIHRFVSSSTEVIYF
jgi:hypothetical protein